MVQMTLMPEHLDHTPIFSAVMTFTLHYLGNIDANMPWLLFRHPGTLSYLAIDLTKVFSNNHLFIMNNF